MINLQHAAIPLPAYPFGSNNRSSVAWNASWQTPGGGARAVFMRLRMFTATPACNENSAIVQVVELHGMTVFRKRLIHRWIERLVKHAYPGKQNVCLTTTVPK